MSRKLIISIIVVVLVAAVATTTLLVSKSANSLEHQLELGNKYLKEGDYEEAILAFERAIEIDEANIEARMGLVEAYIELDDIDQAIDVLEDVIDIDDEYEEAYIQLAELLIEEGELDKALEIIQMGIENTDSEELIALLEGYMPEDASLTEELEIEEDTDDIEVVNTKDTLDYSDITDQAFNISVSSTLNETVGDVEQVYTPLNMFDGDFTTTWSEGGEGNGEGEWVEISSDVSFDLESIQITNGFTRDEEIYYKNNRAKMIAITTDTGESIEAELVDGDLDLQDIGLGFMNITSVRIMFLEVIEGTRYDDLCITEIRINGQSLDINGITINSIDAHSDFDKTDVVIREIINDDYSVDLEVCRINGSDEIIWKQEFNNLRLTELEVYSDYIISNNNVIIPIYGKLYSMDYLTGYINWVYDLSSGGNSLIEGLDDDYYITCYYGNLLECVSFSGEIKWIAKVPEANVDIFWAYDVKIENNFILVYFDSTNIPDAYLVFDRFGNFINANSDEIIFYD